MMNVEQEIVSENGETRTETETDGHKTTLDAVSKYECVPPNSSDFMRFQSQLVNALEELQLKRIGESESEERIKHLMDGQHDLNKKLDEALQRAVKAEDSQEEKVCGIKKQYETQIKSYLEDRNKLAFDCKCAEKEMKGIKDEIMALQLDKYNLEKKLKEQERKLYLQNSNKDATQEQLRELKSTSTSLTKRVNDQESNLGRLAKCVEQYGLLNKKLMYINNHHECEITSYKTRVTSLQEKVLELSTRLQQEPKDDQAKLEDKVRTINKLQQVLMREQESVSELKKELLNIKSDHQKCCQLIQSAHSLVQKQVDLNNEQALQLSNATTSLKEMEDKYAELEAELNEKMQDLTTSKNMYNDALSDWKSKEEAMGSRLETLRVEHKELKVTKENLEELNTKWAKKNMELMSQINEMKAKLEKPTLDIEIQTDRNTSEAEVQATVDTQEIEAQISPDKKEEEVQVSNFGTKDQKEAMMQTDSVDILVNPSEVCDKGVQCFFISDSTKPQQRYTTSSPGVLEQQKCDSVIPATFESPLPVAAFVPYRPDQISSSSRPHIGKFWLTTIDKPNT